MAYPGIPFEDRAIPSNYSKEHPSLPDLINTQRRIATTADVFEAVNEGVITQDFYTWELGEKTEKRKTHFQGILRHPSSNIIYLSGSDMINRASQLFVIEISKYMEGASTENKRILKKGPMGSNIVTGRSLSSQDKLVYNRFFRLQQ